MSVKKSPSWLRALQLGLGAIIIILSIYSLAFPAITYISVIWILALILLFVGIERIIVGIFSPGRSKFINIGLGIVVLVFAGIAMSFPVATAITIVILIGIAFLISGIARIIDGFSRKRTRISRALIIGVGILAVAISIAVIASPLWGAKLAGIIIAIGLLITGIQMVITGIRGRQLASKNIED
jgi:uncharacterized membrane protein HdeD (DUF308 family)